MLRSWHMNTREMATPMFNDTPTIKNLFRALWRTISEWISARIQAYRYKKLDFRELRDDEVTDEMRAEVEKVRNAPKEDFVNF